MRTLTSRRCRVFAAAILLLLACGDAGPSRIVSLSIAPTRTLAVGVGSTVVFGVTARDGSGSRVPASNLTWTTGDASVAAVDQRGAATAVGQGTTIITARVDGVEASASLEVWIPPAVATYEPGTSYVGRRGYVEYIPGDLPLVISAPHGGSLTPEEVPDRTWGETVTDSNTEETLLAVRDAFEERTGFAPHVVISHLKRTKLDPNRDLEEGAQGDPFAANAWREWHAFIDEAEHLVAERYGSGLYIDLHGHGHDIARVELGYLIPAATLDGSDAELDAAAVARESSVRALAAESSVAFSELLRGASSLGGLLASEGVPAVPSPNDPSPGANPYFTGGYDTDVHGSRREGTVVSGVQMELHRTGVRDTDANRRTFGRALAAAVETFMVLHYGFFLPQGAGVVPPPP
jgi:hypothetical protein